MRYFPLLWAGLRRKPIRTLFTMASLIAAFVLFGILSGVNAAFEQVVASAHVNRLYVTSRHSSQLLPIRARAQIERIPHVAGVNAFAYFVAYTGRANSFGVIATDPAQAFAIYPELIVSSEALASMRLRRTGAIVGNSLANRFGWNVGDRISIDSGIPKADGTTQWQLEVLGIFSDSELGDLSFLTRNVIINYDYYDSARVLEQGMVSGFIVDVSDPQHAAATGALIDAEFANSLFETSTVSEKEYTATLVQQVADINLFTELIISAVFFTLLFLTSNTMMQSVRDRIPEYAVLKTVGFSDGAVLALVLTESFVLSVGAAVIGLCIAAIVYPEMTRLPGIQEALGAAKAGSDKITSAAPHLPFVVLLRGLLASAVLALISGVIPAYQAMRLQVVEALARR